ncbi:MAG: hypothetical protein P8X55_17055, partial [Desulfosarcinaceae bacterium]
MTNRITLQADGMLADDAGAVKAQPLKYLGSQLQVETDCTLRSYFQMIEAYEPLARLGDFFQILLQQYRRCPPQGCLWPDYSCLEFAKVVEMIGFPGDPRLEIYNGLRGVKGGETEEIRTLPLEVLMDMPIRLGRLKHVIFGDNVDTF